MNESGRFIVFELHNQAYHKAMNYSLRYILDYKEEKLNLGSWKEFCIRGIVGYSLIRRITNWFGESSDFDEIKTTREYLLRELNVYIVNELQNLPVGFSGYLLDTKDDHLLYFS